MSGRARKRARPERPSRPQQARWGWHCLVEPWPSRVVDAAGVRPGDLVVDLGAGDGALTGLLVAAGARVIAVERHPARLATLRTRFAGENAVTVVGADVTRLRWPRAPFRVVANPPYEATTALLRQLLSPHLRLLSADLVLQRRVVRQVVDGETRLSRRHGQRFELQRGLTVPRTAFRPPPAVDSAVLQIRLR